MTELNFQKELMLTKEINQKNVCFVIIGIFYKKTLSYGPYLCDGCHTMTQKSIDSKNIDIVYFNRNAYNSHAGYLKKKNDEKYLNLDSTKEYESVWSEVKRLEKLRD